MKWKFEWSPGTNQDCKRVTAQRELPSHGLGAVLATPTVQYRNYLFKPQSWGRLLASYLSEWKEDSGCIVQLVGGHSHLYEKVVELLIFPPLDGIDWHLFHMLYFKCLVLKSCSPRFQFLTLDGTEDSLIYMLYLKLQKFLLAWFYVFCLLLLFNTLGNLLKWNILIPSLGEIAGILSVWVFVSRWMTLVRVGRQWWLLQLLERSSF